MRFCVLLSAICLLTSPSADAQWLETIVPLDTSGGVGAFEISYGAATNKVYVSLFRDLPPPVEPAAVAVVDGSSNAVLKTLRLGIQPIVASVGDKMCGSCGDSLAVIDGTRDSVTAFVPIGCWGQSLDYNPTFGKVYVAPYRVDSVVVVDAVADTVLSVVPLTLPVHALTRDTSDAKVYCVSSRVVVVLDASADTILTQIPVGTWQLSGSVCLNTVRDRLYCGELSGLVIIDCDGDSVLGHLPLAGLASSMCYNSHDDKLYVVDPSFPAVVVIDCTSDTVIALVPSGDGPSNLCYNTVNNKVYCADWAGGNVTVIDGATNSVVTTIPIGLSAGPMVHNPCQNRVYVIRSMVSLAVIRDSMPGAIGEDRKPVAPGQEPGPTIVRGVLRIEDSRQNTGYRAELLDISGRKVMELRSGANDIRHLAPGVYFVRRQTVDGKQKTGDRRWKTETGKVVVLR